MSKKITVRRLVEKISKMWGIDEDDLATSFRARRCGGNKVSMRTLSEKEVKEFNLRSPAIEITGDEVRFAYPMKLRGTGTVSLVLLRKEQLTGAVGVNALTVAGGKVGSGSTRYFNI